MGTIAVILDCMQDAHDFIEVDKLKNPYPCNDKHRVERFGKVLRNDQGGRILLSKLSVSPNMSIPKSTRTS
jgi:hypothetical protein